jgi:murein DD-endopeptidase MepM/ murein hydrolase activator NlpD
VHSYPCTHWGVDTFTIDGSRSVVVPESGVVVASSDGTSPPFVGYGPAVVLIKGASGVYHLLAHLERGSIKVSVGQLVSEGDPVGRFDADYGHCHYEIRRKPYGPGDTNTIDPIAWHQGSGGEAEAVSWTWYALAAGAAGYLVWRYGRRR